MAETILSSTFESGIGTWDAQGETYDTFAVSTDWANTGTQSLEVEKNSTAANFYDWSEAPFSPGTTHAVANGEVLTTSLVLRTAADHTVTNAVILTFGCYDAGGSFLGNSSFTNTGATAASTTYTISGATWTVGTDYATTAYVRLNLYEQATAGQKLHVYLDDVLITRPDAVPGPTLATLTRTPMRLG